MTSYPPKHPSSATFQLHHRLRPTTTTTPRAHHTHHGAPRIRLQRPTTPRRHRRRRQRHRLAARRHRRSCPLLLLLLFRIHLPSTLLTHFLQHVTPAPDAQRNFLVVDNKTETAEISKAFESYTRERKDIGILFINQHIAEKIRGQVDSFTEAFPAVLEIPSKDHPYDPEKDSVLRRVRRLFGE